VGVQQAGAFAEIHGALSGSGAVIKDGLGSLLLSGTGALSGDVVVQQGTLWVTNSQTLSQVPNSWWAAASLDQTQPCWM